MIKQTINQILKKQLLTLIKMNKQILNLHRTNKVLI